MGDLDFGQLDKDLYQLRFGESFDVYWRPGLFRDGLPVRYVGVVHEYVTVDSDFSHDRLDGDYYIDSCRLGARNRNPQQKFESDRDLLLAELEPNPEDTRSVFYLAQSYFDLGDFENARKWYQRRVDMGGWAEEVYQSMYRLAESMWSMRAPWPDVQDAYLRAWEFRPTRAEPLYTIAFRYRLDERYQLGYLFAKHAAEIPLPAANLDVCAPPMIEAASRYPETLAQRLFAGPRDHEVTVSLVAGPDRADTDLTLNSFLNSCTDVWRVGRFLVVDADLSAADRANILERYGFLEFVDAAPGSGPGAHLTYLRAQIHGRFWLHLGQGWLFFAPEDLIARLTAVLKAEPQVFQVAINGGETITLSGAGAAADTVRRAPGAGRYVLGERVAYGPAMFDTALLDRLGGISANDPDPLAELNRRAVAAGLATASLDELLCIQPDRT